MKNFTMRPCAEILRTPFADRRLPELSAFTSDMILPAVHRLQEALAGLGFCVQVRMGAVALGLEVYEGDDLALELVVVARCSDCGPCAHILGKDTRTHAVVELTELPIPPWSELPVETSRHILFDCLAECCHRVLSARPFASIPAYANPAIAL